MPANEEKLSSGKLSRQPPVNTDRQHRENRRRISAPHHVPFRGTKPRTHRESASNSKTSTHLNTRSLKHTSFLASQKQQGWERSEEEENRIRISFQYALLRFDRHCADAEGTVLWIRESLSEEIRFFFACGWIVFRTDWQWLAKKSLSMRIWRPWQLQNFYWQDVTPSFWGRFTSVQFRSGADNKTTWGK